MLNYKLSSSTMLEPLIPCGRSEIFRVLKKYRLNNNIEWGKGGQPPILTATTFANSIHDLEKDEGRAISKSDVKHPLKSAKQDVAKIKGNSI